MASLVLDAADGLVWVTDDGVWIAPMRFSNQRRRVLVLVRLRVQPHTDQSTTNRHSCTHSLISQNTHTHRAVRRGILTMYRHVAALLLVIALTGHVGSVAGVACPGSPASAGAGFNM